MLAIETSEHVPILQTAIGPNAMVARVDPASSDMTNRLGRVV